MNKFAKEPLIRHSRTCGFNSAKSWRIGDVGRCRISREIFGSLIKRIGRNRFVRNVLYAIGTTAA